MLVAMFNAVKVECVPLNFSFFGSTLPWRRITYRWSSPQVVNAGTSNSVRQG